jgi:DNA modification methylase
MKESPSGEGTAVATSTAGGRRAPTSTYRFGASRREGHDAADFYERFPAPVISPDDQVVPAVTRDEIWVGDARYMDKVGEIADGSVALVVTSPPYFAGKEYEEALGEGHIPGSYLAFLEMLTEVFAECARKLEPGGRIAVNVANLGRKPYRSLSADVIDILQKLGLLLRGEIIWVKGKAAGGSCAWGSFQRPSNPVLRDLSERVIVASKGRFDRARTPAQRRKAGLPTDATITADEFMDLTYDIWELPPESARRVGHPAPFPVELPRRLIELYTYAGDLVLDPFMGAGSTAVAAVREGRHFVGFDTDPDYVALALNRVTEEQAPSNDVPSGSAGRRNPTGAYVEGAALPAGVTEALGAGRKVTDVAEAALTGTGWADVKEKVRGPGGVDLAFSARDSHGRLWYFDVVGGFSAERPGLRRMEDLWRALGRARVVTGPPHDGGLRDAPSSDGARRDKEVQNRLGWRRVHSNRTGPSDSLDCLQRKKPFDLDGVPFDTSRYEPHVGCVQPHRIADHLLTALHHDVAKLQSSPRCYTN